MLFVQFDSRETENISFFVFGLSINFSIYIDIIYTKMTRPSFVLFRYLYANIAEHLQ